MIFDPNPEAIQEFCLRDPIRYRHILNDAHTYFPELAHAMFEYYQPRPANNAATFYANALNNISMLGVCRNRRFRLEGELQNESTQALRDWCAALGLTGAATTSEAMLGVLGDVLGQDGWSVNHHYWVSRESFRQCSAENICKLSKDDRPAFEAFLQQPADTPFLTIGQSDDTIGRDLTFMSAGLPVRCYGARIGTDIVGVITGLPITDQHVDLARIHVLREYRGRGIGRSLISKATADLLQQGLQPVFATQGDGHIMGRLLGSLGYRLACYFWHCRYWGCQK